jgi:RNA polymerase sigma factor (sigma-70 family)
MTADQLADLYRTHWTDIFCYIARQMRGHDAAVIEDLASATFERACRAADHYQDRGTPLGWLQSIAGRLVIDWRRGAANRAQVVPVTVVDLYRSQTDAGSSQHAAAIDLHAALARLPDQQQQHLDAVYRCGLSNEEAGRALGVTARSTAFRRGKAALIALGAELGKGLPCSD